jgi:hypothetical protein
VIAGADVESCAGNPATVNAGLRMSIEEQVGYTFPSPTGIDASTGA